MVVAPIFEKRAPGLYHNTAAIIDTNGEVAGLYRKMHIPDDPPSTRSSTSRPATSASAPSTRAKGKIGTLICWDQWYPEGARLTALQGAGRPLLSRPRSAGIPHEKGRARRAPARRLAHDPARVTPSPTACTWRS